MMQMKELPDKYTASYRCPDNINNLKIRIKICRNSDQKWTEKTFGWQEKLFRSESDDFLFTYTDEDDFDFDKIQIKMRKSNLMDFSPTEKMFLMADFGDYIENNWIPNEYPLCTIFYQENTKLLHIYPDFTKSRPYYIKKQGFYYFIENASVLLSEGMLMQEQELFNKLIRKNSIGKSFALPPKNKLNIFLFFEILTAKNFDYPQIYVKYFVDLPKFWSCKDHSMLKGMTQVGHGKGWKNLVHFGYNFEIALERDIQGGPENPTIYFEVISKDYWDVYRTEGMAYQVLPVNIPGNHRFDLNCFRFGNNGALQELRRFFIGDCSNYDDLTWIKSPKDLDAPILNKFGVKTIGTGKLKIRLNLVNQTKEENLEINREKLNSSSLIKSVEEVLLAFKSARKNMLEARKQI